MAKQIRFSFFLCCNDGSVLVVSELGRRLSCYDTAMVSTSKETTKQSVYLIFPLYFLELETNSSFKRSLYRIHQVYKECIALTEAFFSD